MMAPTAAELIEAVRERMDRAIDAPVRGFEARVIRNVLAIVERELTLGPQVEQHRARFVEDYGTADEVALAAAVRSGSLDERAGELRRDLRRLAELQLEIDNPRW